MKKYLVFLLVAVFAISILFIGVACKEEAVSTEKIADKEEDVQTEEVADEKEDVQTEEEGPIKLVFWDFAFSGFEDETPREEWYMIRAIERYQEENPGITIEYQNYPGAQSTELLTPAAMAEEGPDIVALWGGRYILDLKDSFVRLNDYFNQEEIDATSGWEFNAENGDYYGTPVNPQVMAIFYNTALFEEAGIDLEQDYDTTFDTFLTLCEKLKNAGITPFIMGVSDGFGMSFFEGNIFASQLKNETAMEVLKELGEGERDFASSAEFINTFKATQELYAKGYFNEDVTNIGFTESKGLFGASKGAMAIGPPQYIIGYRESVGDIGVIQLPSWKSDSPNFGVSIGSGAGCGASVTSYSEHIDESIDFLKFLLTFKEQAELFSHLGILPSTKGDYSDYVSDPLQNLFIDMSQNKPLFDYVDNLLPIDVSNNWFKLESLMLSNQMSVEEFLEAWDIARDESIIE